MNGDVLENVCGSGEWRNERKDHGGGGVHTPSRFVAFGSQGLRRQRSHSDCICCGGRSFDALFMHSLGGDAFLMNRPLKFCICPDEPVLVLAFAVRAAIALCGDFVLHPDEVMQYLEPAHRLVFGNGVTYWEFFYGARAWLVPGVVAPVR